MADLDRIKRNVAKMAQMNAPESDIDGYIASEGVTIEQVRNHKSSNQINQPKSESEPEPEPKKQLATTGDYADIINNTTMSKAQKKVAIKNRYDEINKQIDEDSRKAGRRIALGATMQGISALPIFNIPYLGTGVGGALYDAGSAVVEGKSGKEIAEQAGRGFIIGETVGAIPYVGKLAGKTKLGQSVVNQAGKLGSKIASSEVGKAVGKKIQDIAESEAVKKAAQELTKERHLTKPAVEKVVKKQPQVIKEVKAEVIEQPQQLSLDFNKVDDIIPEQVVEATGKTKERGFVDTVRQNYGDDVAKQITDKEYDVYSHEMQKANWENRTPEQKIQALNEVDNINPDVLYGKAQALNQAIQNGEPLNVAMLDGVAKNLTKAGQEIEAAKHFIPTSPEGIVLETIKQTRKNTPKQVLKLKDETSQIVDEVAKTNAEIEKEFNAWLQKQNLPKQVKQYSEKGDRLALMKAMEKYRQGKIKGEFAKLEEKRLKAIDNILAKRVVKPAERKSLATQLLALNDNNGLTPENFARLVDKHYGIQTIDVSDYAKIQELSERFINAATDRERDVANGLIKKFIWNKQPKKWADKARTYRNINMLFSVPSRLLDVASTAAFQGVRALDELTAKGLDKIARTGVRGGIENMSPKSWFKSVARGAKEGAEDVNLGINTARSGEVDRYELGFHPQFENVPLLGKAEKGLNATIRVPDRMFYEAKFDSALKDLMSTGKFTAEEAEEIARNEALQAVFQGQGLLSRTSKDVRDWFDNLAPDLRIGSHIAPFVQTPANLVAEGLERSPLGLTKGIVQWNRATTPQELRAAQETVAKGLTGSIGAVGLGGYALNKLPNNIGGLTNEDLYGDEVRNLPPQSVVIGDKSISLAGAPYFTIPAGMGKALLTPDKSLAEKTLNSIAYTGNILSDLPMYKGLGDLYKGVGNIFKEANEYATGKDNAQGVVGEVGRLVGQQGANALSQYIPFGGTLGTIRNAADPYNREMMTSNENPLLGTAEYIGNRLQNRIPFASSLLPMKYNTLGEPSMRTNIENPVARIAEATLSPVRIRNYTERPAEMEEMQRIQDYAMENDIAGKTTLKFAKPKRYIGKGKDKLQLTNEEYSELTRLYNGKVFDELQFLMNTPEYQSADEETQIKWVKEVMKEKKKEAEEELFEKFGIIFQ